MSTFGGVRAVALALGTLLISTSLAAAKPASHCYRVALKVRPSWVNGAAWVEDRGTLVVVDPFQSRLLAYTSSGEVSNRLPETLSKATTTLQPAAISEAGESGFLLETVDGSLLRLDRDLQLTKDRVVPKGRGASGHQVGSLIQWTAVGGSIVAYGSILKEGAQDARDAELGFFRTPLSEPPSSQLQMLKPLADLSFYLVGNRYITSTHDAAYFVAMAKHPAIYRISAKGNQAERLNAFPDEFRTRPDFQTVMTSPRNAPEHFAELETFSVASGLYSQEGMLYLLTRKPGAPGQTIWDLYKIDPVKDRVLGKVTLPTSADFLTVVPSPKAWYFLERGPVQDGQRQDINNLLVLESSAVASLASLPSACPSK